jgi:hypothetical protein
VWLQRTDVDHREAKELERRSDLRGDEQDICRQISRTILRRQTPPRMQMGMDPQRMAANHSSLVPEPDLNRDGISETKRFPSNRTKSTSIFLLSLILSYQPSHLHSGLVSECVYLPSPHAAGIALW